MKDTPERERETGSEKTAKSGTFRTTIVGGRPPKRGGQWAEIPRGVEVLIKKASVDATFRQVLLDRRAEAAREIDLELSPAEAALLNSAPRAQLVKIIEKTTVPDAHRRVFLGGIGAAMLSLLTVGLAGCEQPTPETIITVVLGASAIVVTTTSGPTPTPAPTPTRRLSPTVNTEKSYIDIGALEEQPNSLTIPVSYSCPFETGEIAVALRSSYYAHGAVLTYLPAQSIAVSAGSGEVTFTANGTLGTTYWIMVRLWNGAQECGLGQSDWPQEWYTPGEYIVDECDIWRIVEYRKVWSEE